MSLLTYQDLIDHALDYLGAASSSESVRYARNAVQSALRDVAKCHMWTYYLGDGRIVTSAQQTTGTVAYDETGGAYERMVTLTGATWPSWARQGSLKIGEAVYEVAERKSDTIITLTAAANPGADVAASTAYTFYRDTYPLPTDFQEMGRVYIEGQSRSLELVTNEQWIQLHRVYSGPAVPYACAIGGDSNFWGALALRLFPGPDSAYVLRFLYKRQPRKLAIDSYHTGTCSSTSGSATIAGSGTAWNSTHVGAVLRLAADMIDYPTGYSGACPFTMERMIVSVASTVSITVDEVAGDTLTGVKYAISDPVDAESGSMLTFLLREVEKQLRLLRRIKPTPEEMSEYNRAQISAFEADNRNFTSRAAGSVSGLWPNMAQMPFDVSDQ